MKKLIIFLFFSCPVYATVNGSLIEQLGADLYFSLDEQTYYDCESFEDVKEEWEKLTFKLKTLPFTKKDVRNFSRFILSGASTSDFDRQGRINITSPLVQYANLGKNCVLIGVNERIELWNEEEYNTFLNENIENFSDIAENLFEGDEDA